MTNSENPIDLTLAKKLEGFREKSPGLFGPLECKGFCLPEYLRPGRRIFVWGDFDAPLYSGDVAIAFFLTPQGTVNIKGKRVEQTRDGRAWLYAWATPNRDSMFAMPMDCPLLRILAIAPLVAEIEIAGVQEMGDDKAGLITLERYGHISQPAVDEWRSQGFLPRTQLHFENDIRALEELRKEIALWWQPQL